MSSSDTTDEGAEERAKAEWDQRADKYNKWPELGQDEKDVIIRTDWIEMDHQWYVNKRGDAVRGPSYRAGGWWLLPADKPDSREFDVGPFKTRMAAMAHASP